MEDVSKRIEQLEIHGEPSPCNSGMEAGDAGRKEKDSRQRRTKQLPVGLPIEAAASHLLTAGVGWLALKFFRMFKRQQREVQIASGEFLEPLCNAELAVVSRQIDKIINFL